jgi:hypothetical protein
MTGYSEAELAELQRTVRRIATREVSELNLARAAVAEKRPGPEPPMLAVHTGDDSAFGSGQLLVDIDRELRRTVAFLERGSVSPIKDRSNLIVAGGSQTASFDLVLVAYGALASLVLSSPVQVAITLSWFWDRRPSRWGVKKSATPRSVRTINRTVRRATAQALRDGQEVEFYIRHDETDGSIEASFRSRN